MTNSKIVKQLIAQEITSHNFQPFGQVIWASEDGKKYDKDDAQLSLENGIPRFYIMRLNNKGLKFTKITRHGQCTQCLGSLEGKEWLMAVAAPCTEDAPKLEDVIAFKIPGNCFIKLEVGTWHAGPYFEQDFVDFYNLELSDTNVVDHFTHDFAKSHNLELEIV
ncbi:ureidoglycolate lyase [Okeania sp.]|uniref:ureidoglycolate lyase n=1 Tax=Okeania sp. TaxID=3100323 RepID=UPI002B4B43A7|nr:ureidoglycolate lyase [Okeania sp.]MEB3339284.1 ureidoglycolate lyase [Okeania sp.]